MAVWYLRKMLPLGRCVHEAEESMQTGGSISIVFLVLVKVLIN